MVDGVLEPCFLETPIIYIIDPSCCTAMDNGMECVNRRNPVPDVSWMKDVVSVMPHRNMFPKFVAFHLRSNVKKLVWNGWCNGNLGSTSILGLPINWGSSALHSETTLVLVDAFAAQSKTNDQVGRHGLRPLPVSTRCHVEDSYCRHPFSSFLLTAR